MVEGKIMLDQTISDQLKNFTQFVTFQLLPLYDQHHVGKGKDFWCVDWWTIEVGKFLFNGEETYLGDPPPYRLRNNKNFAKEKIIEDGKVKLAMFETLKKIKDSADTLLVCEVGRGLELILAHFVKKWKKIYCYDYNPLYKDLLDTYFVNQLGMNIVFNNCKTAKFPFEDIEEDTILIASHVQMRKDVAEKILMNDCIVKVILNGKLTEKRGGLVDWIR